MKNATELLNAYLAQIQDPAAALFADDGVIELPTINARAQGPPRSRSSSPGCSRRCRTSGSRTSASGSRRPIRPSASTTWRRACRRPGRSIDRPTPAGSSRRTARSSSCASHSTHSSRRHSWSEKSISPSSSPIAARCPASLSVVFGIDAVLLVVSAAPWAAPLLRARPWGPVVVITRGGSVVCSPQHQRQAEGDGAVEPTHRVRDPARQQLRRVENHSSTKS
jgi:hypothetical protein